jgi:hypothetical protein
LLPAKPDSGNCLAFYRPQFKTGTLTRTESVFLPFRAARALCTLQATGRSSCRVKNTLTSQLNKNAKFSGVKHKNGKKNYGNDKTSGRGWKGQSVAAYWAGSGATWRKYNGFLQGV